jgi:hypothetical protein
LFKERRWDGSGVVILHNSEPFQDQTVEQYGWEILQHSRHSPHVVPLESVSWGFQKVFSCRHDALHAFFFIMGSDVTIFQWNKSLNKGSDSVVM